MTIAVLLLAGVTVFLAVVLQSAVGFGMALFAIPVLLWLGADLPTAVAMLVVSTAAQSFYGVAVYRQHIPWRAVWAVTPWRFAFMIAGVWLLWYLDALPRDTIKQIVGLTMLAILLVQVALRIKPRARLHGGWTVLAGTLSGLMAGALGMGGPPIVLWAMAHDWPSRVTRSFFWAVFALLAPLQIAVMTIRFGYGIWAGLILGLALAPGTILAARLGVKLGERMNRQRLRQVALGILALIAAAAIAEPWLR